MHKGYYDILHQRLHRYRSRTLILSISIESNDHKLSINVLIMSIRSLEFFLSIEKRFFHDFNASVDVRENTIFKK